MYQDIAEKILALSAGKDRFTVAVDGRCASGKTTLAAELEKKLDCNVFHMDDFFLRPFQRTDERLNEAGGNVDRERFEKEVMIPLIRNEDLYYCPYSCKTGELLEPVKVSFKSINIIEGAYSCHPDLWDYYDMRIFISTDYETQLERIKARSGEESLGNFINKWIPLEEKYFKAFDIQTRCDMKVKT